VLLIDLPSATESAGRLKKQIWYLKIATLFQRIVDINFGSISWCMLVSSNKWIEMSEDTIQVSQLDSYLVV